MGTMSLANKRRAWTAAVAGAAGSATFPPDDQYMHSRIIKDQQRASQCACMHKQELTASSSRNMEAVCCVAVDSSLLGVCGCRQLHNVSALAPCCLHAPRVVACDSLCMCTGSWLGVTVDILSLHKACVLLF